MMISRISAGTLVAALLQLGVDLLHRLQAHSDHDQDASAAERQFGRYAEEGDRDVRDQRDDGQVERAGERQPGEHVVEVLLGRLARPDAGDEAAVLLHVVGDLGRVEGDRDVEVGEEDDQQRSR
jgi:hypothetical protein